ncbi:hypothetical protein [Mucilaginibacter sp.]|uniref:hypothetical protein n=1 Tax=Mucilaginibacter sp. TaxID=1882438 RepID=UPI0032675AD5
MIRAINTCRHVKNLCRFFNNIHNTFEVPDSETIAVVSGKFSGLTFAFETGICTVSTANGCTSFDLADDFSPEVLVQVLMKHHIIKYGDLEEAHGVFIMQA